MKRFKKVYIEITNICNLACDFCPQTKREPEFMSIDTFKKILQQIKPYTDYIYLHVKGEPFLHPDLSQILEISQEHQFKVNITTNGTLIQEVKDILIMKEAVRQINFSLHSFDGNDGLTNKTEYVKDILGFTKEAREKSKILISLRLWNFNKEDSMNQNIQKNKVLIDMIEKEFALPYKIEDIAVSERGIKLAEGVYLNQEYEFQWPNLNEVAQEETGFCYGLRNQIAILVNGTVVPCCLDGEGVIDLGNIKNTEFKDIVESEKAINIMEGFTKKKITEELCRKCGYRKRF